MIGLHKQCLPIPVPLPCNKFRLVFGIHYGATTIDGSLYNPASTEGRLNQEEASAFLDDANKYISAYNLRRNKLENYCLLVNHYEYNLNSHF